MLALASIFWASFQLLIGSFLGFFFFFFFLFTTTPLAHGNSPARSHIGAAAVAFATATATWDLSCICDLRQILNPVSKAGIKPTSSWVLVGFLTHRATKGTPYFLDGTFWCRKVLNFDEIHLIFSLIAYAFGVMSKTII